MNFFFQISNIGILASIIAKMDLALKWQQVKPV
jgi:hypothetical protein